MTPHMSPTDGEKAAVDKGVNIIDLFAGPGGWDEALRLLGRTDVVGIEHERHACLTAVAAGHRRIQADVSTYPVERLGWREGLLASPPCQAFSEAGKGNGKEHLAALIDAIAASDWAARPDPDPRVWLVLEVGRWVEQMNPDWIACEQVPAVLPLWRAYESVLQRLGYITWAGILNAADYGVPQTRQRAFLMGAKRSRKAPILFPPAATHDQRPRTDLWGNELKPWVTMAEALGWGFDDEPSCTVSAGGAETGGAEPFANAGYRRRLAAFVSAGVTGEGRPKDPHSQPADTITGKGTAYWLRSPQSVQGGPRARRESNEPSVTVTPNFDRALWCFDRPATTVVASFRPDIISGPGYRTEVSRQDAEGGVRVTAAEGGVLQSFRADYPWQGPSTRQYQQVGNAIPVLLAAHVAAAAMGCGYSTEHLSLQASLTGKRAES